MTDAGRAGVRTMKPLGKHQLCLLATMGSPFSLLVVDDPLATSLVKRSYLRPHFHPTKTGGFLAITPTGLRALAVALENGEIEQFFDSRYLRDRARIYIDAKKQPESPRP